MANKQEAKAAVKDIAKTFGAVDDDDWAQIEAFSPAIRRRLEEAMLAKDELAAHSIKT